MPRIVLVPAPTGDGRIVLRAEVETRAEAARRWLDRLLKR
jgi:hypothetical protein